MKHFIMAAGLIFALTGAASHAAIVTFDKLVEGTSRFTLDADGDYMRDVTFSTTDPAGFSRDGPSVGHQNYISGPGLEGTSELAPDVRVDFLQGAVGPLSFAFVMDPRPSSSLRLPIPGVTFSVFDPSHVLIASVSAGADYTKKMDPKQVSQFPEARLTATFSGVASYALFDFDSVESRRYMLDNFAGTFGSSEGVPPTEGIPAIPEPRTAILLAFGLATVLLMTQRAFCLRRAPCPSTARPVN